MVDADAIGATLRSHSEPEAAAQHLVAQANDAGGRDNVTVVVVNFDAAESQGVTEHGEMR